MLSLLVAAVARRVANEARYVQKIYIESYRTHLSSICETSILIALEVEDSLNKVKQDEEDILVEEFLRGDESSPLKNHTFTSQSPILSNSSCLAGGGAAAVSFVPSSTAVFSVSNENSQQSATTITPPHVDLLRSPISDDSGGGRRSSGIISSGIGASSSGVFHSSAVGGDDDVLGGSAMLMTNNGSMTVNPLTAVQSQTFNVLTSAIQNAQSRSKLKERGATNFSFHDGEAAEFVQETETDTIGPEDSDVTHAANTSGGVAVIARRTVDAHDVIEESVTPETPQLGPASGLRR
jgi:hypothetical protein